MGPPTLRDAGTMINPQTQSQSTSECGEHVFLQLCSEDDSEHGESDGSGEAQIRVEQQGEDKSGDPDHLVTESSEFIPT